MREVPLGPSSPLVPPLFQSSVYVLPDLDAIDRVYQGEEPGFIYARDAHPNARLLGAELARLEGAEWAVVCGSGMSALAAAALAVVGQGDRIVASDALYGRTTQFLSQELARFGVSAALVDSNDLGAVEAALAGGDGGPAKLLVVETISNPLLRVADVPALAGLARRQGCLVLVDNTFATPVLCRPLEVELGADLVLESVTKMIGGHGDVTLGVVAGRAGLGDLGGRVARVMSVWGLMSSPFECWLAQRSLGTLPLRARAAAANAAALAEWLAGRPGVRRVVYPGRADHPDQAVARRLLGPHPGHMLCLELAGGREAVNRFMRQAPGVPFSPSLGDWQTTCSHPVTTSHRYADPAERARQGITDGLVRLSVGVEPLGQIQEELAKGLA
jgi:cystathionine beta-lyase/cystathionine gamma-synthase